MKSVPVGQISPSNFVRGGFVKQHHSILFAVHQLADILIIWGLLTALVSAADLQWGSGYQFAAFLSSISYHIISRKNGLYSSWRGQRLMDELKAVFVSWFFALGTALVAAFAFDLAEEFGGAVMIVWAATVPLTVGLYRVSARTVLREFRRAGINTRKVAIVGAKEPGITLAASMLDSAWMGINIAGFFDDRVAIGEQPLENEDLRVVGNIEQLIQRVRNNEFDDVYLALPMREDETIKLLVKELANSSVCVHMVPDIFTFNMLNARSRQIGGLPVVSVYDSPFDSFDTLVKRVEDVVLSTIILSLIAIPMLFIAAAVKFTSAGPVIFKQRRYGINGEEIMVWKFRSMTTCDNGDVVVQATKNDMRITKVGGFLRKTSLDELPQFINVLQGTMSIVGPRPHAVAHNELYRDQIDGYMQRHLVKPGITGWAQINGWRGETDTLEKMEKRVEFDLHYIRNWSLWWDLKIVLQTIFKSILDKAAY